MSFDTFTFVLTSGILLGGLYALMATGLAVVWTTLGVFNFAHGALLALGAFIAWQVTQGVAGGATFLRKTSTGRSMRAVAQNREAADLMGLNVSQLFAITTGLAAATAALACVFIGSLRFVNPSFGADPLMKSLIVVVL